MQNQELESVGIDAELFANDDLAQKCSDHTKKLMDVMALNRKGYDGDSRFKDFTPQDIKMIIDLSFLISRSSHFDIYIYEILIPRLESIEARLKELELQREVR